MVFSKKLTKFLMEAYNGIYLNLFQLNFYVIDFALLDVCLILNYKKE